MTSAPTAALCRARAGAGPPATRPVKQCPARSQDRPSRSLLGGAQWRENSPGKGRGDRRGGKRGGGGTTRRKRKCENVRGAPAGTPEAAGASKLGAAGPDHGTVITFINVELPGHSSLVPCTATTLSAEA